MIASWNSWRKEVQKMMEEKRLPSLEEIYWEAFYPLDIDFISGYDAYKLHYSNNLVVRFTAWGCTICRTLQELCYAAQVPYGAIYIDDIKVAADISDLLSDSYKYVEESVLGLIDSRRPTTPWCIDICVALYKLIANLQQ